MANIIYLTLTGAKQGLISSGCSTFDSIGNRYQSGHEDEIFTLALRHTITRDQNVKHNPVEIIKPIDKSSPLLGVSISDNEILKCVFDIYRGTPEGVLKKYYTIKLNDASIANISIDYPHSLTHADKQPHEMVLFYYKDITWTNHATGTSGYSLWEERVY
ncbi:Hcp family type VI secretion system effector [Samsonia erythrinae]|uniref:Type VI secretion system secreted protein Hcp n=1 Tax=Samsonia erythrinae TaxID=160434 RepID=A0A4R3VR19_9GAMM|nr:Hcp family type VI secretion system effector [Samsonia erythrinae]TCV07812.1 hypothetical protein EDC54_102384 [Samsonia erythrinae]